MGVLKVGHIDLRAAVEGIDDHPAVGRRAGDFHPAVGQVGRRRRHPPVARADAAGFGQKIRPGAGVNFRLATHAGRHQTAPGRLKVAVQPGDKAERIGGHQISILRRHGAENLDVVIVRHNPSSRLMMLEDVM